MSMMTMIMIVEIIIKIPLMKATIIITKTREKYKFRSILQYTDNDKNADNF